ncbi:MAG: polyribonucleotide nucleotidyltransferase, partial [Caulobacteraceae bacterium]
MFDVKSVSMDWAGRKLTLETGRVARQADGAVFATWGETALLATVVYAKEAKPGQDFFPLTVNYQEKYFASGRIPGGFFKREGRPTERETLLSRLIDRPIRPLFVEGFKNEVQVIITVLSWDNENESDLLAMVATSAALTISGVPFMGPIAASRVGWIDNKPVLNPTIEQMKTSDLDLVVAGTANAIMMVESEVKELTEPQMLEALALAHKGMQPVIDAIIDLAEKAGKEPFEFDPPDHSALQAKIVALVGADLGAAYKVTKKDERYAAVGALREKAKAALVKSDANPDGADANVFKETFKAVESDIVRTRIVKEKGRIDGRPVDKVRPI